MRREGTIGTAVRDWQATLNMLAARGTTSQPQLAVDGVFGPRTRAATQAFQRWANIAADRIVGCRPTPPPPRLSDGARPGPCITAGGGPGLGAGLTTN